MIANKAMLLLTLTLSLWAGVAVGAESAADSAKRDTTKVKNIDHLRELLADNQDADVLLEQVRNMPNVEVGNGITFESKKGFFKTTMRFRMQNLVAVSLDEDFAYREMNATVRRLRLRFDGYLYTPQLTYSIQLGFSPDDCRPLPNGNMNIVRDAMIYYIPSTMWSIGFGQTKIRGNRATLNSSSALQFADRSIVNKEFSLDRDFGFFGEFYMPDNHRFTMNVKGSVTTGDGRNWGVAKNGGLAYTARVELFPLGRFRSKGEVVEGDYFREQTPKIMIGATYSYNDRAMRLRGESGSSMPNGQTRSLNSYFVDFILKYRGYAFYAEYMGRDCNSPLFSGSTEAVFVGQGVNVQTSYLFKNNWEVAIRNSTLMPQRAVQPYVGYKALNQTTLGVTKYIIGHSLKVQADVSYNARVNPSVKPYTGWEFRFQVELGI